MPQQDDPSSVVCELTRMLAHAAPGQDLIATGADLSPDLLLEAYRHGFFPMGLGRHGRGPVGWWSPDPRGVLPLDGLRLTRSWRRSARRFEVRVDTAFEQVVAGCADRRRPGRWITPAVAAAYARLHRLGHAHSIETWREGDLVGGLYGVEVGGLFAGESMFSAATDASKVALLALVRLLSADGDPRRLLDVQWVTPHLASLGVVEVPRPEYLRRLADAVQAPPARWAVPPPTPTPP